MLCRVFCLHCQNNSESRSGKTRTKVCERSLPAPEGRNQESLHTSAHLVNSQRMCLLSLIIVLLFPLYHKQFLRMFSLRALFTCSRHNTCAGHRFYLNYPRIKEIGKPDHMEKTNLPWINIWLLRFTKFVQIRKGWCSQQTVTSYPTPYFSDAKALALAKRTRKSTQVLADLRSTCFNFNFNFIAFVT